MNNKVKSLSLILPALLIAVSIVACASPEPTQTQSVVIAPLGSGGSASASGITREELEDHVRRFADRYITRVALAANALSNNTEDQKQKELMLRWKSTSYASVVDIAIGPNAVTKLLDMMTLTMLSRIMIESHWVPNVFVPELGADFLQSFVDLEDDSWVVADDVLTGRQQDELKSRVNDWYTQNPDQIYPWYVRLSDFSGQR